MARRNVIVIGASAGGVPALRALAERLPPDLPAAVLVVLHVGGHRSILPELLQRQGALKASHAIDGEPLREGHIFVAPPDHHLLLERDRLRLSRGAKEHHTRPAIDPLFRSAALSHGSQVIGVVLSGTLDDGTAGLQAVKARGGIAVVQDPREAAEPSMPLSALRHARVDHTATIEAMAPLLAQLARTDVAFVPPPQSQLAHEQALMLLQGAAMKHLNAIGQPSTFVCPDCQGALWEIKGVQPERFRCHVGHAFTLRTLEHAQADATDEALWSAIRALEEKQMLLGKLAEERRREHHDSEAARLDQQATDTRRHAEMLRGLLETVPGPIDQG